MDQGEREESAFNPDVWKPPYAPAPQTDAQTSGVDSQPRSLATELAAVADVARTLSERLACLAQKGGLQAAPIEAEKARALGDRLQRVRETALAAAGIEELTTLETLLQAWNEKPSDLLIMVKVAEEAAVLNRIVRAQLEIMRLTEEE